MMIYKMASECLAYPLNPSNPLFNFQSSQQSLSSTSDRLVHDRNPVTTDVQTLRVTSIDDQNHHTLFVCCHIQQIHVHLYIYICIHICLILSTSILAMSVNSGKLFLILCTLEYGASNYMKRKNPNNFVPGQDS